MEMGELEERDALSQARLQLTSAPPCDILIVLDDFNTTSNTHYSYFMVPMAWA